MRYQILTDFNGSQDGRFSESFKAGTEAELSDYLVSCVPPAWIRAVGAAPIIENKAVVSDGSATGRKKKS